MGVKGLGRDEEARRGKMLVLLEPTQLEPKGTGTEVTSGRRFITVG